jgi:hypothetical protein
MNFIYATTPEEFEQIEKTINHDRDDNDKIKIIPQGDVDRVIIVVKDNIQIVGEVAVSIYSSKTLKRKSVWLFGENKYRTAWIDRIDSSVKGVGRILLEKAKEWVNQRIHLCKRKNLYVASIVDNFYRKCGYTRVYTPDSSGDEDSPWVYEANGIHIMALPLSDQLDKEKTMYSICDSDFSNLIMVLEGEPDTENLLLKAKEIIERNFIEENDLNESYIISTCLDCGNDIVTQYIIETLSSFPNVDKKAIQYAKEGKERFKKYQSDLDKGLEKREEN